MRDASGTGSDRPTRTAHLEREMRLGTRRTGAVTSALDPAAPPAVAVRFRDRADAGRRLAVLLEPYGEQRPIVLAIPRGGVPVATEIARALDAPLDVVVVRKVGAPGNPEFAIGALAEGDVRILSEQAVQALGLSGEALKQLLARGERELLQRLLRYRGECEPVSLRGRTAILVDDGLATGSSALAAVESLRRRGAARVILAVPVAAPQAVRMLSRSADEVLCVEAPTSLWAVGYWYEDFRPTRDEDITALLAERRAGGTQPADRSADPAAP